jgi:hypothetical protein
VTDAGARGGDLQSLGRSRRAGHLLLLGFLVAVVVRGGYWLLTLFLVGPMFGPVGAFFSPNAALLVAEIVLTGAFGIATPVVGVGMLIAPARFRPLGHVLSWIFTVDTTAYLASVVVTAPFLIDWRSHLVSLGVVAAGNLCLLVLAVATVRQTSLRAMELEVHR